MKVLLVSHVDMNLFLFRGALIVELLRQGWEVYTAAPGGEYTRGLRDLGARTLSYDVVRGSLQPGDIFRAVKSLRRVISDVRPDIVHSFTHLPNILARLANSGCAPLVNSITGRGSWFTKPGVSGFLAREFLGRSYWLTSPRCRTIVFQNPDDLGLFRGRGWLGKSRAFLVRGSGVDLDRFKPGAVPSDKSTELRTSLGLRPDDVVFPLAGRMVRDKGVSEFIEAAAMLAKHPRARFLLVGAADPGNISCLNPGEIRSATRPDNIVFAGWRRDMETVWAASDVAVLPSAYGEGVPVTLQEASASGLPAITTDVPGCRELAGKGTILVPPRDSRSLSEAMSRLLADPGLRKSMDQASRAKAMAEFDARTLARAQIELYRTLLGRQS